MNTASMLSLEEVRRFKESRKNQSLTVINNALRPSFRALLN